MDVPKNGVVVGNDGRSRCWWCSGDSQYERYHDTEWGRPVNDDRRIFEKIILEGFQSGLSWLTILRKRDNFRKAFSSFDIEKVARFNEQKVEKLMLDAGIVRNRAKIESTINNAQKCLDLIEDQGTLSGYFWSFEPTGRPRSPLTRTKLMELPVASEAAALSKDLKRRGWSYVGPTTINSVMESIGLVNDHLGKCDFREEVEADRESFTRPAIG